MKILQLFYQNLYAQKNVISIYCYPPINITFGNNREIYRGKRYRYLITFTLILRNIMHSV